MLIIDFKPKSTITACMLSCSTSLHATCSNSEITSHSRRSVTRSASRRLMMSGVVMRTASLASVMAVMKPVLMSAGQSIRMKSGQPCERAFSASTSQVTALPPNSRGSLERGLEMQRSSKLDQRLSQTRAWSRWQSPFRTSITV